MCLVLQSRFLRRRLKGRDTVQAVDEGTALESAPVGEAGLSRGRSRAEMQLQQSLSRLHGSSETGMALQSCAELVLGAGASYVSILLSLEAGCPGRELTLE